MSWIRVDVQGTSLPVALVRSGRGAWVSVRGLTRYVTPEAAAPSDPRSPERDLRAPMTGRVVTVSAIVGLSVRARDTLVVLEAMKMEYRLTAPRDGVIEAVSCAEGERVDLGRVLVTLAP
ncbi:MAG TPA: biotin/lipoyl-containing protein [Planctomycetota bacterium]|nr:biotin/lipoyl-containing protein [Planctomycetota bacterium]